ncbi:trigger factor [Agrococcus sp. Marseille-Q4369]|uniref:trigger factor n=1 Tax=Agrococcus sp. Marseille-Q4369 TaxID=2810513 RepID=UPI001B8DA22D|nr:trigger factor [Agrococcus sp. Marseille-Q4369]QUW19419.1 trigger factor [Agrococcus sp. Marseille-Q4369]
MKTTVEKIENTRTKLTIAVEPEELRPAIDSAYKAVAEQISVPGFRKGKVPAAIIDQRIGREEILNQAVSESIDEFYRQGVAEAGIRPLGRPQADVTAWPELGDFSGDLVLEIEVDVRPEFDLPEVDGRTITVDAIEIGDDAVQEELDALRSRFGTLVTVDRPAAKGDFVTLDLTATIDGEVVDTANGISYEVGSGELIDGIDEAVDSLTAGEETTFTSKLVGGDHAGKDAEVTVTVDAVKERELPEADDDFAQMASAFDTIDELKADLKEQAARSRRMGQAEQARQRLQEELVEAVEIEVPSAVVEDEVTRHLEAENRADDTEHGEEVRQETRKLLKQQMLFDRFAEDANLQVTQQELTQIIVQQAAQYGMAPQELVQALEANGQLPVLLGDILRGKTLSTLLGRVSVVDDKGEAVDLSDFLPPADEVDEDDVEGAIREAEAKLAAQHQED